MHGLTVHIFETAKKGTDREEKDYTHASTCQGRWILSCATKDGGVVGEDIILPQQQIKDPMKMFIFMGFLHFRRTRSLPYQRTPTKTSSPNLHSFLKVTQSVKLEKIVF